MATIVVKVPTPERYELPANTCPIIDKTIAGLEEIRTANEQLREASHAYLRDNKQYAVANTRLVEENERLEKENKSLQITRDWLSDVSSGAITSDASKVIELEARLMEYKNVSDVLEDALRIATRSITMYKFRRLLKDSSQEYLMQTEERRQKEELALRTSGLNKLTEDERLALGIDKIPVPNVIVDDDEEED